MVNQQKLKQLFPHGSKAFLSLNPDLGLQDPDRERASRSSLDHVLPRKKEGHGRAHVILTAFTVRPRDPDNLGCGSKGLLDAIKKLGLIRDDDPYSIELSLKQRHVERFEEEKTLLEIIYQ